MTEQTPENPTQEVAKGNVPEIDYDKLAASLKNVLPQAPAPVQQPVASGNSDFATRAEIDALPEKMVNAFREAFTPAKAPEEEAPKEEAPATKEPGSKSFVERWFGSGVA
jgi:hypothetical protein